MSPVVLFAFLFALSMSEANRIFDYKVEVTFGVNEEFEKEFAVSFGRHIILSTSLTHIRHRANFTWKLRTMESARTKQL